MNNWRPKNYGQLYKLSRAPVLSCRRLWPDRVIQLSMYVGVTSLFALSNWAFFQKLMGVCGKFTSNLCDDWPASKTFETNCLNVALTFKIPDVLKEKPNGMHISEIGNKTGLEERKAGRILRLLATKHVFREGSCLSTSIYSLVWCIS